MWVHPHLEWVEKAYRPSKCYQMLLTFSPLKSGLHLNYWHADDKSYIPSRISWVLRRIVCVRDASEWVMRCHSLNEEGREKKKRGIFWVVSLMSFQCSPCIFLLPLFPVPRSFLCPARVCGCWGRCCSPAPWPPCWSPKGSLTMFWLHKPSPGQRHQSSLYFQYLSSPSSPYLYLYRKWLLSLLSLPPSNPSAQTLSSASSPHSSIPPCAVPTPGIPSFPPLSARDSCHLGPIRSDWSSILQRQVHLICEALQLGLL